MKNLENSALMQEMNVNEMQEVNGGWVALALAVVLQFMYTIIGMIFAWGLMRDGTEQEINH